LFNLPYLVSFWLNRWLKHLVEHYCDIVVQMDKTMFACFGVPSYGLSFPLTPQSLASLSTLRGRLKQADGAAMPCDLCGEWIDRPQWRHVWYADTSGVPAESQFRFRVCVACSVTRNIALISEVTVTVVDLVPSENIEDLNERLEELLAWIARRAARRQHRATQACVTV
jgi:hypothetical protein